MYLTQESLQEENERLDAIIAKVEANLEYAPTESKLRISQHAGKPRFYVKKRGESSKGTYLSADQISIAQKIAQKDYDCKILKQAKEERQLLADYMQSRTAKDNSEFSLEKLYSTLHPSRQKLITPWVLSDDDYARQWESVPYEKKAISNQNPSLQTAKGELVRSKSEAIIANALFARGVPYQYEKPIDLPGIGVFHPDFFVLNKRTRKEYIWEHLGLMDNAAYASQASKKLALYARNGWIVGQNLVITLETAQQPIDSCLVESLIRKVLE